jgi:acyl carrier protein
MITMDEFNKVFQQVFDDDSLQVTPATTANDVEGWDSLSHVNLIVALEMIFNTRFTQKELLSFKNVGDLFNSINAKAGAQ